MPMLRVLRMLRPPAASRATTPRRWRDGGPPQALPAPRRIDQGDVRVPGQGPQGGGPAAAARWREVAHLSVPRVQPVASHVPAAGRWCRMTGQLLTAEQLAERWQI